MKSHIEYMKLALLEAEKAQARGEVPIGAVVVYNGEIIGRGFNLRESTHDATAHAEMIAIRQASQHLQGWRLVNCSLYVTLEPCAMCAGAILQSRIDTIVYGAKDPKAGCVGTLYHLLQDSRFNHQATVHSGVLEKECGQILSTFFQQLRQHKRQSISN